MRTWMIGSAEDCDVVVAQPRVSGRHCRLSETADGYLLEDLGSSNGTYVNGERIAAATQVSGGDRITLGAIVPMPWPPTSGVPGATLLRIGRTADNDIVLDDARVSSRHARLIVSGSRTLIEDAGSSNGTFVNSPDQRLTRAVPLTATDTVYFGSLAVPAARLLPSRPALVEAVLTPPPLPEPAAPAAPERATEHPAAVTAAITPWTILVLAQAPVMAILIVLAFGRPSAAAEVASTTFALALSAVWLGGSLAVWASLAGQPSSGRSDALKARILASPGLRFAILAALCAIQCALLLAVVYLGSGLRGSWPSMFGVLILASAVGLSLGWAVFALVLSPRMAVPVLMVSFLAMIALGGRIWPLPASSLGAADRGDDALALGVRGTPAPGERATRGPDGPRRIGIGASRGPGRGFLSRGVRADGAEGRCHGPRLHADRAGGGRRIHLGVTIV